MKIQAVFDKVDGTAWKIHNGVQKDIRSARDKGGLRGFFSLATAGVCVKGVASIPVEAATALTWLTACAARKKLDINPSRFNK